VAWFQNICIAISFAYKHELLRPMSVKPFARKQSALGDLLMITGVFRAGVQSSFNCLWPSVR